MGEPEKSNDSIKRELKRFRYFNLTLLQLMGLIAIFGLLLTYIMQYFLT